MDGPLRKSLRKACCPQPWRAPELEPGACWRRPLGPKERPGGLPATACLAAGGLSRAWCPELEVPCVSLLRPRRAPSSSGCPHCLAVHPSVEGDPRPQCRGAPRSRECQCALVHALAQVAGPQFLFHPGLPPHPGPRVKSLLKRSFTAATETHTLNNINRKLLQFLSLCRRNP